MNKKWIVTTSGDQSLNEIKKQLTEKGFTVERVLDQIECITGSADDDVAEQIKQIPGVTDVSPDTNIDIGSPDESVTW